MKNILTLGIAALFSFNVSAGMVVVGNVEGVDKLTKKDVKKIFMGKKTKLSNGSKILVVELDEGTEGRRAFHDVATGRSNSQLQSAWSRLMFTGKASPTVSVTSYQSVIEEVSKEKGAVGYIDESALTDSVKVLFKY